MDPKHQTAEDLWSSIRLALRDDIKSAYDLIREHDAIEALAHKFGCEGPAEREKLIKAIHSMDIPSTVSGFFAWVEILKKVTDFPPEAAPMFNRFLAGYYFRSIPPFTAIARKALALAEDALAKAKDSEAQLFQSRGLPTQQTEISAGPARVVARIKEMLAGLATATQVHHAPKLHPNALRELFVEEILAEETELQAMAKEAGDRYFAATGKKLGSHIPTVELLAGKLN